MSTEQTEQTQTTQTIGANLQSQIDILAGALINEHIAQSTNVSDITKFLNADERYMNKTYTDTNGIVHNYTIKEVIKEEALQHIDIEFKNHESKADIDDTEFKDDCTLQIISYNEEDNLTRTESEIKTKDNKIVRLYNAALSDLSGFIVKTELIGITDQNDYINTWTMTYDRGLRYFKNDEFDSSHLDDVTTFKEHFSLNVASLDIGIGDFVMTDNKISLSHYFTPEENSVYRHDKKFIDSGEIKCVNMYVLKQDSNDLGKSLNTLINEQFTDEDQKKEVIRIINLFIEKIISTKPF